MNGRGKYSDEHGVYEGEYRDGKKNGRGVLVWADGDRYDGEWKDSKMHGRGKFSDENGVYEGEYRDGKKNGSGVLVWADGDRYEGEWKDSKTHGRGKFSDQNGVYEGEYRDGKKTDAVCWCGPTATDTTVSGKTARDTDAVLTYLRAAADMKATGWAASRMETAHIGPPEAIPMMGTGQTDALSRANVGRL